MYAQEARRLRRAEKRAEWNEKNNQALVVSGKASTGNTLSLKRNATSRVTKAVDTETEYRKQLNAKAAEYNIPQLPEGSICIPDVAIYYAGHRKSVSVSAR